MLNCKNCIKQCKASCCGVVPFKKEFIKRYKPLKNILNELDLGNDYVILQTEDMTCPYLNEKYECSIYKHRPEVCIKFGDETLPVLTCPYQDKDGRIRSRQERRALERDQEKRFKQFKNSL